MIEIGDIIKLKDDIPKNCRDFSAGYFPMKVETIGECNLNAPECAECPGEINEECFGRGKDGFIVEKVVPKDWDE